MTEGEEGKGKVAKAQRSSPSVDRIVRGENARSLASQQRPDSIEFTEMELQSQPIRRSNEPASHPMRERDGSARGDSRYYRPHTSDSIRQVAGATNDGDHQTRGIDSTQVNAVDRGLWCIVLFGPGCTIQDDIRLHVVASKVLIRIAADGMDEWARKDAKTQREKTEGQFDTNAVIACGRILDRARSQCYAIQNHRGTVRRIDVQIIDRPAPVRSAVQTSNSNLAIPFASLRLCVRRWIGPNAWHHPGRVVNKCADRTRATEPLVCMPLFATIASVLLSELR
jgi:hypothetical protein